MARTDQQHAVVLATPKIPQATLPLISVNHISFAVPQPRQTADFFQSVLGFKKLRRPAAFVDSFDGAWVCGMGLEIHFIQPTHPNSNAVIHRVHDRLRNASADQPIDPRNDHLSFLCVDSGPTSAWDSVIRMLKEADVKYVERCFPEDDLKQVSFCHTHVICFLIPPSNRKDIPQLFTFAPLA